MNADGITVSCRSVSKRYGATQALAAVDIDVRAGSVHALVGENGAGKSTLLGIVAGRVTPSEGEVSIGGEQLDYGDPRASRRAGIATIYQELTIVPALSTQANVFLGQPETRTGWLREGTMRERFRALCEKLDLQLPADVPAGALSVADQQLVEILRALVAEPRVILFDEPTASLAPHEREVLFRVMRELRTQNVALLIVSHNLDEVLEIADEVTVFRDGQRVASGAAKEWSKQSLIKAMLGRTLAEHVPAPRDSRVDQAATPILRVEEAQVPGALFPTTLKVMPGEILGIGGLVGSGRTTLLRALAGAAGRGAGGQMWVDGAPVRWPHTPLQARKLGIALLSEDRQGSGLLTRMSAADNVVVSDFSAVATGGFLSRRAMRERARAAVGDLGFDLDRLGAKAATFSGGNQQKLLIGRWRYHRPLVLLADEPTRGVDIGAKEEILRALRDLAAAGTAVVLVSSELEEVVSIADRVLVLSEGHLVGELSCGDGSASVEAILNMAFRAQEEAV